MRYDAFSDWDGLGRSERASEAVTQCLRPLSPFSEWVGAGAVIFSPLEFPTIKTKRRIIERRSSQIQVKTIESLVNKYSNAYSSEEPCVRIYGILEEHIHQAFDNNPQLRL